MPPPSEILHQVTITYHTNTDKFSFTIPPSWSRRRFKNWLKNKKERIDEIKEKLLNQVKEKGA